MAGVMHLLGEDLLPTCGGDGKAYSATPVRQDVTCAACLDASCPACLTAGVVVQFPTIPARPRGDDRREAPRREVDRDLHYARENLLAAALVVAETARHPYATIEGLADLDRAAATYRRAELAHHQENQR